MSRTERSFPIAVRALAAACALFGLALLVPATTADAQTAPSQSDVQTAHQRYRDSVQHLQQLNAELQRIQQQLNAQAAVVDRAQSALEQVTAQLLETRQKIDEARARYERIQTRLNDRAAEAFMQGPGSSLDLVLGAQTIADLSDRIEFVSALTQSDAELGQQVANLRNTLSYSEARQQTLQDTRRATLDDAQAEQQKIQGLFAEQQQTRDQIQAETARALSVWHDRKKAYERHQRELQQMAQQYGGGSHTPVAIPASWSGILQHCPVPGSAFGNGFGAPRYAGGFHLHAGVDMLANYGTPIYAPFDGTASTSYNTLGGNAVYVRGQYGYVYNAHLQSYSANSTGPVRAGDVIGYVGDTGDAKGTPHDHFEFHPYVMPGSWPASDYGYSIIGSAINPYPLLVQACG